MAKCCACGVEHERWKDSAHTKPASYCLICHRLYMREHRVPHRLLQPAARRRANARSYANVYQRRGKIVRQPCERCGGPAEKHHDDYDKPLAVRWLCRACHLNIHGKDRAAHGL